MTLNKTIYYTVKPSPIEDGWRSSDYYKIYVIIDNELALIADKYLGGWFTIKDYDALVKDYLKDFEPQYAEWKIQQL